MITADERKYLTQIAEGLPSIELTPKRTFTHKKGHTLTKKEIAWIIETHELDKDWKPTPSSKYTVVKITTPLHQHLPKLIEAWEKERSAGVNAYVLAAKNLAANLEKITPNT